MNSTQRTATKILTEIDHQDPDAWDDAMGSLAQLLVNDDSFVANLLGYLEDDLPRAVSLLVDEGYHLYRAALEVESE